MYTQRVIRGHFKHDWDSNKHKNLAGRLWHNHNIKLFYPLSLICQRPIVLLFWKISWVPLLPTTCFNYKVRRSTSDGNQTHDLLIATSIHDHWATKYIIIWFGLTCFVWFQGLSDFKGISRLQQKKSFVLNSYRHAVVGAVACGAGQPGFDPSSYQLFFLSGV